MSSKSSMIQLGRLWEEPKGGRRCQPIICPANLPETLTLESIMAERYIHYQEEPQGPGPNVGTGMMIGQDSLEG